MTLKTLIAKNISSNNIERMFTGKLIAKKVGRSIINETDIDIEQIKNIIENNYQDYSAIKVSNSTPDTDIESQIYLDNNISKFIAIKDLSIKNWSTSSNINTGRYDLVGSGSISAGLIWGGREFFNSSILTEEYNGTSWQNSSNLNSSVEKHAGAGTQTATVSFGGDDDRSSTEEYNGTTWTTSGNMIAGRGQLAGFGTQTSAVAIAGYRNSSLSNLTEEYNGTTWTTSGNINTSRVNLSGSGIENAGLIFGGNNGAYLSSTEEYNGTAWSTSSSLITERESCSGSGSQSSTLAFGGINTTILRSSEEYNGTAWTSSEKLINVRYAMAGFGSSDRLCVSGRNELFWQLTSTEEYILSVLTKQSLDLTNEDVISGTVIYSALSPMNTSKIFHSACGSSQNLAYAWHGYTSSFSSETYIEQSLVGPFYKKWLGDLNSKTINAETFNGITWSSISNTLNYGWMSGNGGLVSGGFIYLNNKPEDISRGTLYKYDSTSDTHSTIVSNGPLQVNTSQGTNGIINNSFIVTGDLTRNTSSFVSYSGKGTQYWSNSTWRTLQDNIQGSETGCGDKNNFITVNGTIRYYNLYGNSTSTKFDGSTWKSSATTVSNDLAASRMCGNGSSAFLVDNYTRGSSSDINEYYDGEIFTSYSGTKLLHDVWNSVGNESYANFQLTGSAEKGLLIGGGKNIGGSSQGYANHTNNTISYTLY